jgi:Mitochondrial K+-H+ exchange-related
MNVYLIQLRDNSVILYTEGERTHPTARPDSADLLDRFLARLDRKKGRLARFLKNSVVIVRDFYYKLEFKIDPMERVFRRLRHASQLTLFYSPPLGEPSALKKFEALLNRQKNKHTFWIGVDFFFSIVALTLTPFLVPIPGPNLFLYYPVLRLIGHYLARQGALHGLKLGHKFLVPLPEISDLERILNQQPLEFETVRTLAQRLKLEQLPTFLERYS